MLNSPVSYSPGVEDVGPEEGPTIEKLNAVFDEILETTAKDYGHAVRSVHAKGHAVLEGTMTVDNNLAPELAQGLFEKPGPHPIVMRISTNAGDILPDAIGLPRGLAIKVLDVAGERLPGAEGTTQDFVMVDGKTFGAKTADKFLQNLKLLAKTTDRGTGAKVVLSKILQGTNALLESVGIKSPMIQQLGGAPNLNPLGETYYSVTPFRYGSYIAKFSVAPVSRELTDLTGEAITIDGRPNAIRETMARQMSRIPGEWEFRVQLCRDLESQPVEDPTVEWNEADAPFVRVARIRVSPQDSWEESRVQAIDEETRFSVWTGLAAHKPLGNINRARNSTYRHSSRFRERFNGCPMHEPEGSLTAASHER